MTADKASSKLIGKLLQVWRGPVAQMGFGRAAPAKAPAFILVVSLPRNDPELARAAVRGGADAVVLHLNESYPDLARTFGNLATEREAIQSVAKAVGGVPWGAHIGGDAALSAEDVDSLKTLGADFLAADVDVAPASLLSAEGIARVMAIGRDVGPYLLRTLNELPIEGIVAASLDEGVSAGPIKVLDLMKYRQVTDLTRQPVIIDTQGRLRPEDVPALRRADAQGILLGVNTIGDQPGEVEEVTRSWRDAIDQAGGPLTRGRSPGAILPQVASPQHPGGIEEPEEPEEPDEDW
jgi:hypothetical protein